MFTGWHPAFSTARGLYPAELNDQLDRSHRPEIAPDDAIAMTRFNSTYIEMIDRTFKTKGMFATLAGTCALLAFLVGTTLLPWGPIMKESGAFSSNFSAAVMMSVTLVGLCIRFWITHLGKDVFQYTHYPIRFNRRTGNVYFFRRNGPGGVTVVPWDSPSLFFHVGRGGQDARLHDLRCHLLDSNRQVLETFVVGHFWNSPAQVHKAWELICRYMQVGPRHAFASPAGGVITLSTRSTLRNHWMMVCLILGAGFFPLRHTLLFPLYASLTVSRWLIFKSCRAPVFPAEIEAACAIVENDPAVLPEPRFMAEFSRALAIGQRVRERRWEWNAHDSAMLLHRGWIGWWVTSWVIAGPAMFDGFKDFALSNYYGAWMICLGFSLVFTMFLRNIGWGIRPSPSFQ